MSRRLLRADLLIACLLSLVLVALAAAPMTAATPKRSGYNEKYAHHLVNCLRTGGKITLAGNCKGYGSGKHSGWVKPLKRSQSISNKVSWPWARRSVKFYGQRTCWIGHSRYGSTIGSRFRSASFKATPYGENMGCYQAYPRKAVLKVLLMWQREKSYRGIHWRQLKSKKFKSAGYGVARFGRSKTQLVVNFYGLEVK